MILKETHIIIYGTCEYATLLGQKWLAYVTILRTYMGRLFQII